MLKKIRVRPGLLANLNEADYALYQKVIGHFAEFSTHGAHLEKLYSHTAAPLYSIRANKEVRLILTPIKHNNEQYWLLIDILEHHQYEQLANRPNSWLAQQINKTLLHDNDDFDLSTVNEHHEVEFLEESGIEFHQQRFIVLDEEQQKATHATLPLVVSGVPGSGKSCVLLSAMKQFIQQTLNTMADNEVLYLLYVARSPALVAFMANEWQAIVALDFPQLSGYQVDFKTPEQLYQDSLRQQSDSYVEPQRVDYNFFSQWFTDYKNKQRYLYTLVEDSELFTLVTAQVEKIYQEFRTISGYTSFAKYNEAIGRHSLFSQERERSLIWSIYQHYSDVLSKANQIDLAFFKGLIPTGRDFIVVDEGQDFSRAQIHDFFDSVRNHQLLIAVGEHQRLQGSESIIPYIKSLYWPKHIVNHISLTHSYRCPAKMVQIANAVLQFKYHAIGGSLVLDRKHESLFINTAVNNELGTVHWLDSEEELAPFIKNRDNAHFAVITLPEFKAEAQGLFGPEFVFTAEEIKGLEYQDILLYRILEHDGFRAINALFASPFQLYANHFEAVIAKNCIGSVIHNVMFNELLVAITRAQKVLACYQPKVDAIRNIRTPLRQLVKEHNNINIAITPVCSSPEEWSMRAKTLLAHGQTKQAMAINQRLADMTVPVASSSSVSTVAKLETQQKKPVLEFAKKNNAVKALVSETKEYEALVLRIYTHDTSALRQILVHAKAATYLFELQLPKQKNSSLFQWLVVNNTTMLTKATHAILKDIMKCKKPTAAQRANHATFLSLLFVTQEVALGQQTIHSLFALVLHEIKNSNDMLLYIKKNAVAEQLIACLNATWHKGLNLVICAAESNDPLLMGALAQLGADLNQPLDDGSTAAYIAAEMGHDKVLIKLHQLKADLAKPSKEGVTPLFIGAAAGHVHVIETFYKLGINISAFSIFGTSVASTAAHRGHIPLLHKLHALGIKFHAVTSDGKSAALIAAANNQAQVLAALHKLGYNLAQPGPDGITPITLATLNNNINALDKLVELGVNINNRNQLGMTLAFPTIQLDMPVMLRHLHQLGIDLNIQALDGTTVAHLAAYAPDCKLMKVLYDCHANLNIADSDGITPLFLAILYEREAIVAFLLQCFKVLDANELICNLNIDAIRTMDILNNQSARDKYEEVVLSKKSSCGIFASITPAEMAYIRGHQGLIKLLTVAAKPSALGLFAQSSMTTSPSVDRAHTENAALN